MRIAEFALERYFARWEFAVRAPAVRVRRRGPGRWPSCWPWPTTRRARCGTDLRLGYTESTGHPLLRAEIAALYDAARGRRRARLRGRRGGDLRLANALARAGRPRDRRHWPGYQCLHEVGPRGRRRGHPPRAARERRLGARPRRGCARRSRPDDAARSSSTPRTTRRACCPTPPRTATARRARRRGRRAPPRRRGLPLPRARRRRRACPPAPTSGRAACSLGVMSKSFALAGLRIGWLATRDRELLARCAAFKDYTTICSSAPVRDPRARSRCGRATRCSPAAARSSTPTSPLLDAFFARRADALRVGPPARRLDRLPAAARRRADRRLRRAPGRGRGRAAPAGLDVRPPGNHFRIGFGRAVPAGSRGSRRSSSARSGRDCSALSFCTELVPGDALVIASRSTIHRWTPPPNRTSGGTPTNAMPPLG